MFKRHIISIVLIFSLLSAAFVFKDIPIKSERKPIIGIMLNQGDDKSYSIFPWYAMRKNYSQVIVDNGGVPVFIGHDYQLVDEYLNLLDGIVLTGGDFQTSDDAFTTGVKTLPDPIKFPRERMEIELIQKAYQRNIPVIGTCAGMQEMNIALGGTLYANLMKDYGTKMQHRFEDRAKKQHSIKIEKGSLLHKIVKSDNFEVNSNHNAGIKNVAPKLTVVALAPDGVIEAFEAKDKKFFIGVMWHPEFVLSDEEKALWKAFVEAAKG